MAAKLCSDIITQQKVNHLRNIIINKKQKSGFPSFEEYAYLAKKIPFYAYDNPEFLKLCDTAFTDSRAIYFSKDFINRCFDHDMEMSKQGIVSFSAIFLALHELKHIYERDFNRLLGVIPDNLLNIGQDIHNNLQLKFDLNIPLADSSPLGIGYGTTKDEWNKFSGLTSDTICIDLFQQAINQRKEKMKQNQPSQGQPGQGQPSQGQPGQGQPSQGQPGQTISEELANNGDSRYQNLDESLDKNKANGNQHVVSPQAVKDASDAAGLSDKSKDRLDVRTELDLQAIEEMNRINVQKAIDETEAAHSKLNDADKRSTSAGTERGHYRKKVNLDEKGQITWQAFCEETAFLGSGDDSAYTEDVLFDGFYSDPSMFEGVIIPRQRKEATAIALIDTSGSMSSKYIDKSFTECLSSIETSGIDEILVFPADVDLGDKHWVLNKSNIETVREELRNIGGGGTDFTIPLKNALAVAKELDKEVLFSAFFTDLGCCIPCFEYAMIENELDELPPTIFITDNSDKDYIKSFENECGEYAVVFQYGESLKINLEEINEQLEELEELSKNEYNMASM